MYETILLLLVKENTYKEFQLVKKLEINKSLTNQDLVDYRPVLVY